MSFEIGIPPHEFFERAWAGEPLTGILGEETEVSSALPPPDEDISLIAKNEREVVGQCSANRITKYWNHLEHIDVAGQNLSTRIFIRIHQQAIKNEKEYLSELGEPADKSFHNAGIAVLPEERGKKLGLTLLRMQIDLCKQHKMTTLFCETTNRFSASIAEKLGFTKIAEYPYSKLAIDLNHADLNLLNDSFTVWCLRV